MSYLQRPWPSKRVGLSEYVSVDLGVWQTVNENKPREYVPSRSDDLGPGRWALDESSSSSDDSTIRDRLPIGGGSAEQGNVKEMNVGGSDAKFVVEMSGRGRGGEQISSWHVVDI